MSRFTYFKIAFVAAAAGITTYQLIVGLFDIDWNTHKALWKLLGKSILVGFVSALILGILNAAFKFIPGKASKKLNS